MLTLNLAIVLLLILLDGFFAMAEIALVSARPARLQPMAANGNGGADAALELKADPSRLLATVQIGITIIAVLLGSFGEATLGEDLKDYLEGYSGFLGHYRHPITMAARMCTRSAWRSSCSGFPMSRSYWVSWSRSASR